MTIVSLSGPLSGSVGQRAQCLLGLLVFIALAWAIGRLRGHRERLPWRVLAWGVGRQVAFALLVLWTPYVLTTVNDVINALLEYTRAGAKLVFGELANHYVPVQPAPVESAPVTGYARTAASFAFF